MLQRLNPDLLAAQSFVGLSFEQPLYTSDIDALGVLRVLEAVREICPSARLYQASTSEMFGKVRETPQNERTPFYPRNASSQQSVQIDHANAPRREGNRSASCPGQGDRRTYYLNSTLRTL